MKIKRFEDIIAWGKTRELVKEIYKLTDRSKGFKADYSLKDQIRRAAVSSMSNIAEGFGRKGDKEFANFLNIAIGSITEVQSQLYVALDLGYIGEDEFKRIYDLAREGARLLTNFQKYLIK